MVSLKVLTSTLAEDSTRVSTICHQSYKTFFFFVADSQVKTIKLECLFLVSFFSLISGHYTIQLLDFWMLHQCIERSYAKKAPKRCFAQVGSSLTRKHCSRMEKLVRNKPSGLFSPFVSYKEIFYNIGPRCQCYAKIFLITNASLSHR